MALGIAFSLTVALIIGPTSGYANGACRQKNTGTIGAVPGLRQNDGCCRGQSVLIVAVGGAIASGPEFA